MLTKLPTGDWVDAEDVRGVEICESGDDSPPEVVVLDRRNKVIFLYPYATVEAARLGADALAAEINLGLARHAATPQTQLPEGRQGWPATR